MTRILATLALLAAAAFMVLPSSASAAPQSNGIEMDRSATAPTDISAHRRRAYRRYHHGTPYYGAYAAPYPYYAYSYYRPYAYREWYWGPRIFRYGPWW